MPVMAAAACVAAPLLDLLIGVGLAGICTRIYYVYICRYKLCVHMNTYGFICLLLGI
jgi:Ca2+/Na+ antiporter